MSFDTPQGGGGRDVGRQAACAVPEQFKVISGFQVMNYKVFPHLHPPYLWVGRGDASSMHDAHPLEGREGVRGWGL